MASDRKKEQEEINSLLSEESSALEKILGLQNDVKNMMQQKLQLKNKELQEQKSLTQFIQSGLDIETKQQENMGEFETIPWDITRKGTSTSVR